MTDPYYQDDRVTLYHGDCLEVTEWLEADVLVTDPPYGTGWEQSFGSNAKSAREQKIYVGNVLAGDAYGGKNRLSRSSGTAGKPPIREQVIQSWGASRPAIVFGTWRVERPNAVKSVLIWHKAGAFSGMANCAFMTDHEEIYILGEGDWRKSSPPLMSVITTTERRSRAVNSIGHPTPKPVRLMEILVDRCPPGVIADPFAGSGSTLVAARNLGRKAIGVEIEEKYCELIAKRLDQLCFDFEEVNGAAVAG